MLPILLFFGALIAAVAVASAATGKKKPALATGCTSEDEAFVKSVLKLLASGTEVPPDMIAKAHAIALRCFPATAIELAKAMNRGLPGLAPIPADRIPVPIPTAPFSPPIPELAPTPSVPLLFPRPAEPLTARPLPAVPEVLDLKAHPDLLGRATVALATPDNPPAPIPLKDGKTLWFIETKKGKPMAIPRFPEVMAEFKAFQKIIGVKQDGRIGTDTLKTFISVASKRGFTNVPKTIPSLAANVTKWGLVLASPLRRTGGAVSGQLAYW